MYIKDFAIKTGLSIDTLRYYEEEKLLIPARNEKKLSCLYGRRLLLGTAFT